jgi:opacity protein-like surface antigen
MKKLFLIPVTALFLCFGTQISLKAQIVEQGNIVIEPYYGFPNLMSGLLRLQAELISDSNLVVKSFGPAGIRGEFMVSDKLGLGFDFYYANSSAEYTSNETDSLGNSVTYTYKASIPRPRFLVRATAHLAESDVVDPYFVFGLGYNATKLKLTTNDPNYSEDDVAVRQLLPIAYRIGFGTRIYFMDNLGIGLEVGLGGPFATAGITVKF